MVWESAEVAADCYRSLESNRVHHLMDHNTPFWALELSERETKHVLKNEICHHFLFYNNVASMELVLDLSEFLAALVKKDLNGPTMYSFFIVRPDIFSKVHFSKI